VQKIVSETLQIWLFAGGFALIAVLFGLFYRHESKCKTTSEDVAVLKEQMRSAKDEIGDHETGLRGSLHKLRGEVTPYILKEQMRRKE
jgi:hypothetical protein